MSASYGAPVTATMAPVKKQKQTLLPLRQFMKLPAKATLKAHDKLEKSNGLTYSPPRKVLLPKIDKKKQLRLQEEKSILEGGDAWRRYMEVKGFDDIERHDPCMLFQVYGPPPDPDTTSSSDDDLSGTDEIVGKSDIEDELSETDEIVCKSDNSSY